MKNWNVGDTCPFCHHHTRSDNLRSHLVANHNLDTLLPGWELCANNVIVKANVKPRSGFFVGVCRGCHTVIDPISKNAPRSLFESHVCKAKQTRNKKKDTLETESMETDSAEKLPLVLLLENKEQELLEEIQQLKESIQKKEAAYAALKEYLSLVKELTES